MTAPRRIDHLVIAVDDLEDAAGFCEGLGFQVGERNRHPWGTENRLVQFASSFLELIVVGEGAQIPPHEPSVFSFGAWVQDGAARGGGLIMVAFDSDDAVSDAALFAAAGAGDFAPFRFERDARRPDGSTGRVGFELAFAMSASMPQAALFVCQQLAPEAFWNPVLQHHPNGATDVADVVIPAVDDSAEAFLSSVTGGRHDGSGVRIARDQWVGLGERDAAASFSVHVPDLDVVREVLAAGDVRWTRSDGVVRIPASSPLGVELRFTSDLTSRD